MNTAKVLFVILIGFVVSAVVSASSLQCILLPEETGSWFSPDTWSTGTIPTSLDETYVGGAGTMDNQTVEITSGTAVADVLMISTYATNGKIVLKQGGNATLRQAYIGYNYTGTWEQNGGVLNIDYMMLGTMDRWISQGSVRVWNNAVINVGGYITVGHACQGLFYLGDANTPATINNKPSTNAGLVVRNGVATTYYNSECRFEGWGNVNLTWLDTLGKIVANGYGIDRTLDLSPISAINSAENYPYAQVSIYNDPTWVVVKNSGADGWYARLHGKLIYPKIVVPAGDAVVACGETNADTIIDMVNSLRLTCTAVTGGELHVSLLSLDRDDVHLPDGKWIGLWEFNNLGGDVVGQSGSVQVQIRYDSELAKSLGFDTTQAISMYAYDISTSKWNKVETTIDSTNMIATSTVTKLTKLALGTVPETCVQKWEWKLGSQADLNKDCHVDLKDLAVFCGSWLSCDDPAGCI